MMLQQRGGPLRGGTPTVFSADYLKQLLNLIHEPGKMFGFGFSIGEHRITVSPTR
ncbi:MAG: hypothetical protein WBY88_10430 [Desulfosarcina sp.]